MGKVYIVHCVDTEGPLYESLEATFQRIEAITGLSFLPSEENLKKIQNKDMPAGGYEDILANTFSERVMAYNKDWTNLDQMLNNITSEDFRNKYVDSNGKGWQFTWFIMDHVNYDTNPRSKVVGYNAIWDHYMEYYKLHGIKYDDFQWHVHPANTYNAGNHSGVSYWNSPHVLQSLCHRIIDRGYFPNAFRAGYHTERPDSHWFLEQYIPYDFSNQAIESTDSDDKQRDLAGGRFGDWRRAKADWGFYHPSHDDYQLEGACRRYIFRCLNVGTRLRLITQAEVDKAFRRASDGKDTVLAFCDHDFREMKYDIQEVYDMIKKSASQFPDVEWINSTAREAACAVTNDSYKGMKLDITLRRESDNRCKIDIKSNIDSFGPQPFFAVKLKGNRYIAEQLDVQIPNRQWSYVFDDDSIKAEDVECIGVATNSRYKSGALKVLTLDDDVVFDNMW